LFASAHVVLHETAHHIRILWWSNAILVLGSHLHHLLHHLLLLRHILRIVSVQCICKHHVHSHLAFELLHWHLWIHHLLVPLLLVHATVRKTTIHVHLWHWGHHIILTTHTHFFYAAFTFSLYIGISMCKRALVAIFALAI